MSTRISGPYIAKQRKTPNPKQILHAIVGQESIVLTYALHQNKTKQNKLAK